MGGWPWELRVDGRWAQAIQEASCLSLYACRGRYGRQQEGLAEPWLSDCVAVYRVLCPLCLR